MLNTKKRRGIFFDIFFRSSRSVWPSLSEPSIRNHRNTAQLNRGNPEPKALGVALCNGVRAYAFHVTRLGFVGALRKKAFQSYLSGAPPGGDGFPIARNSWVRGKECNNCNQFDKGWRESMMDDMVESTLAILIIK